MNLEEQFLGRLKDAQSSFALQALTRPSGRDTFAFGHSVGYVAGLEKAQEILLEMFREARDDEPGLKKI